MNNATTSSASFHKRLKDTRWETRDSNQRQARAECGFFGGGWLHTCAPVVLTPFCVTEIFFLLQTPVSSLWRLNRTVAQESAGGKDTACSLTAVGREIAASHAVANLGSILSSRAEHLLKDVGVCRTLYLVASTDRTLILDCRVAVFQVVCSLPEKPKGATYRWRTCQHESARTDPRANRPSTHNPELMFGSVWSTQRCRLLVGRVCGTRRDDDCARVWPAYTQNLNLVAMSVRGKLKNQQQDDVMHR